MTFEFNEKLISRKQAAKNPQGMRYKRAIISRWKWIHRNNINKTIHHSTEPLQAQWKMSNQKTRVNLSTSRDKAATQYMLNTNKTTTNSLQIALRTSFCFYLLCTCHTYKQHLIYDKFGHKSRVDYMLTRWESILKPIGIAHQVYMLPLFNYLMWDNMWVIFQQHL